ncbi:endonuclease/exonuclease/phosphatase family protein [Caenispirillum salinarum]|uniref:endonuclease/exonuclease/phosphatase family protein n=1 Tax=Caenispirillum salinarum TaxID=859058 RepID=UPI00384DF84D
MSCTVVTLNTWKGDGAYRTRLRLMAAELAALRPDVVLLQEALAAADGTVDTAARLAEACALPHRVRHTGRRKARMVEGRRLDTTSGLAVLSRRPITGHRVVELPADPRDGDRQALIAHTTDADGAPMVAATTHLTHLDDSPGLRRAQRDAVLAALAGIRDRPVVLGGDFNAGPESPVIAELSGCRAGGADFSPPTLLPADGRGRADSLDHLFLLAGPWRAVRVARVLDAADPATGLYPSDHAGVLAVFG